MENKPDGQYCYVCHPVDHFSNFYVIFPLASQEARVIANGTNIYVFLYFGLPKIIHSHNWSEFINDIIAGLIKFWSGEASFINGAPCHSQSQGLVEQGNNSNENFISVCEQEEHQYW